MSRESLELALSKFDGNQSKLQRRVNAAISQLKSEGLYADESPPSHIKQSHIWEWLYRRKKHVPPAEYVLPIEMATGVCRSVLRPDLYRNNVSN